MDQDRAALEAHPPAPTHAFNNDLSMNGPYSPLPAIICLALALLGSVPPNYGQSAAIHVFIVTQLDSTIGSFHDRVSVATFLDQLRAKTDAAVFAEFIDADDATTQYVDEKIKERPIGSNDAVWYHYSGHGNNYDGWPQSSRQVALTWVHRRLKKTPARFTLVTFDCSANGEAVAPETELSEYLLPGPCTGTADLKALFLYSRRSIAITATKGKQFAYGSPKTGGIFTNALLDALLQRGTWEAVFCMTRQTVQNVVSRLSLQQTPRIAIEARDEASIRFELPAFPWPPPQCAQRQSLVSNLTSTFQTFAEVDERICLALNANGYSQKSYFQVPNGFALVTQLEQFNPDGTSRTGDGRWATNPVQEDVSSIWQYFVQLIVPKPGQYRLFVFIVTDVGYNLASHLVTREEADAWMKDGLNRLPGRLGQKKLSAEHTLDVLVYEFETPVTTKACSLKCSGTKDIITHLQNSGLGLIRYDQRK